MREILFRGKTDKGEWVQGDLSQHKTGKKFIKCGSAINSFEVVPATVGQYTGLTDKNGKKIFEGDIIQTKRTGLKGEKIYRFVIKYGEYIPFEYCKGIYSKCQTIGFYAFDGNREYQLSNYKEMLEVIGNIHDNPELLGGEQK